MAGQETLSSPREERPRPAGRFKGLSDRTPLRTKLITAVLGLVIVALAVISVASVYMLRGAVTTQRDTTLTSEFPKISTNESPPGYATQLEMGSGLIAGIQAPGSQLTWAASSGAHFTFGGTPQGSLPALPTGANWAGSAAPVMMTVPSQSGPDTWRVMAETITDYQYVGSSGAEVAPTVTLVLAVDVGNVNALTTRLVLFDLIVGGAIVVVLAAVGVAVVQANLRPLNDIELTAGQIAAGHLDHRVPEGDSRTEIGSLGRSLNAMLTQVERAFHAQGEAEQAAHASEERMRRFIADAAHELRTPLTTIRGFAAHYRQRGGASGRRSPVPANGAAAEVAAAGLAGPVSAAEGKFGSSRTDSADSAAAGYSARNGAPADGLSPGELDRLMGRIEAEATRMGVLVEDLLTLARLDQQRPLHLAPVDLLTLAADAVQDARIVAPGRPIDLVVAPGTAFIVDGDESRLRQVIGNLVNNAVTHTPADTPVRVKIGQGTLEADRAGGAGRSGGTLAAEDRSVWVTGTGAAGKPAPGAGTVPAVVLDVEDDGPGMTADQARRVFERFYRADAARNRASGGTGLGLAIVAGLVTAHGGTVALRTAPGEGADFQVKLPLSPDALPSDEPDDDLPG